MPADIDPNANPALPARCPRKLPGGRARCLSLVLVRDADEHELWHDDLEAALTAPVEVHSDLEVAQWTGRSAASDADELTGGSGIL